MPVATLEPVQIGGVTVQHASLHNTHFVAALDLRIGDTVFVERRGDVIPQVTRVLLAERPPRTAAWQPPDVCAACGTKLALRNRATPNSGDAPSAVKKAASAGVEMLMCPNEGCSARQGRLLRHFARVCAKGLGDKTVEMLAERGLVSAPTDLYTLKDRAAEVRHRGNSWPPDGSQRISLKYTRFSNNAYLKYTLLLNNFGCMQECVK